MFTRSLIAVAAAALFVQGAPGRAATPPSGLHWIVSQSSVWRLRQGMPANDVDELFDNPNTYVIINASRKGDPLPHAEHVAFYRDEKLMAADLAAGRLAGVDGVLYDDESYNEPGNTTPEDQKANPLPYVQDAARLLHTAHKLFLYTIGPSVGPRGSFWNTTLASVSPYPDVIDFQTQGAEGTPRFAAQVAHYSQIYRRNGGHLLLVGLAVAPRGQYKSTQDIRSAYDAGLANNPPVDGFWLNIAVKSASCTGCATAADVTPGVQFLESILK
ncbi:MAG TPA: hypothetical protein VKT72_04080 [Candidatus Baltobacteraceae bacterium]|nr:hypothetical protein [Candidatus Baltobacteraceae bacterium]